MTPSLDSLRAEIDAIDEEFVALVARRVGLARAVATEKARLGVPLLDPAREGEVVERAAASGAKAGLDADELRALIRRLLALSRRAQLGAYERARAGGAAAAADPDAGGPRTPHP